MKIRTFVLAGVLVIAAASVVHALSAVHVDFQASAAAGVTAPGYVAVDNTARWDQNSPVDLGGGVQGAWPGYLNGDFRDRATTNPLLRDFVIMGGNTFQVRGLQPGTYDLTLYATDPSPSWGGTTQQRFDVDANNDGLADASLTLIEPQHQTQGTVTLVVSSAGRLSIACTALNGAWGVCNGFDMVAGTPDTTVPAPVTDLAVSGTNGSQAMLQWTAPADAPSGARAEQLRHPLLDEPDHRGELVLGFPGTRRARSSCPGTSRDVHRQRPGPRYDVLLRAEVRRRQRKRFGPVERSRRSHVQPGYLAASSHRESRRNHRDLPTGDAHLDRAG